MADTNPRATAPRRREAGASPSRRLSPAEFQILIAAYALGRPTIREIREFIATLPPLTTALRRTRTPADASRGVMPSYNNINTLLLRMTAAGAVAMEDQEGEIARRIVPRWSLEETLAQCVEYSLRDYLVWKPLVPQALATVLDQIARQYSAAEESALRELLSRESDGALSRWKTAVKEPARSPRPPKRVKS